MMSPASGRAGAQRPTPGKPTLRYGAAMAALTRLEQAAPRTALALRSASALQRRAAARIACERAVAATSLAGPEVEAALAALVAGKQDQAARMKVHKLSLRLDEEHTQLQEHGAVHEMLKALVFFNQARAALALVYALSHDDKDMHEAIYEACAALEDNEPLLKEVDRTLAQSTE
jgi:hypothetical protein